MTSAYKICFEKYLNKKNVHNNVIKAQQFSLFTFSFQFFFVAYIFNFTSKACFKTVLKISFCILKKCCEFFSFIYKSLKDVNECQLGSHDCGDGQRCDNTIGSYQCARVTGCGTGYTLNSASGLCEDDDECILGTDNCRSLGNKYQCRNTLGSYRCERVKCTDCFVSRVYTSSTRFVPVRTEPTRNYPVAQAPVKICLPGYVMSSAGQCEGNNYVCLILMFIEILTKNV